MFVATAVTEGRRMYTAGTASCHRMYWFGSQLHMARVGSPQQQTAYLMSRVLCIVLVNEFHIRLEYLKALAILHAMQGASQGACMPGLTESFSLSSNRKRLGMATNDEGAMDSLRERSGIICAMCESKKHSSCLAA